MTDDEDESARYRWLGQCRPHQECRGILRIPDVVIFNPRAVAQDDEESIKRALRRVAGWQMTRLDYRKLVHRPPSRPAPIIQIIPRSESSPLSQHVGDLRDRTFAVYR